MLLLLLLKIACISLPEHLNSLRGQFWGRAALAPVILFRVRALLLFSNMDEFFYLQQLKHDSDITLFCSSHLVLGGGSTIATLLAAAASH
jgi:hypothetical protein